MIYLICLILSATSSTSSSMETAFSQDFNRTIDSFGNLNYACSYFEFSDMFTTLVNHGLSTQSLHIYIAEEVVPGHYYWQGYDSLLYAALDNDVEVILRIDEAYRPVFYPLEWRHRYSDWLYFTEYYDYLDLMVERYKPNGLLQQSTYLPTGKGVYRYSLLQETDLFWAAATFCGIGGDNTPADMKVPELITYYEICKSKLDFTGSILSFGLMGMPYGEMGPQLWWWGVGLDSQDEYDEYIGLVLQEFDQRNLTLDALDWHQFTLWNDPGYPGPDLWTEDDPNHQRWSYMYLSDRAKHNNDLLSSYGFSDVPIQNLEGATTPYWVNFCEITRTAYYHSVHQLTSNAEVAVGGNTDIILFDLDIDDITGNATPPDFNYEDWWDDSYDPLSRADSLLQAITKQTELLTGRYCLDRINIGSGSYPVFMYEFIHPNSINSSVYQVRPMGIEGEVAELPLLSSGLPVYFDDLTTASFEVNTRYLNRHSMFGYNELPIPYDCGQRQPYTVNLTYPRGQRIVQWFEEIPNPIAQSSEVSLQISANPTYGGANVKITFEGSNNDSVQGITVTDLMGRVISRHSILPEQSVFSISTIEMPSGLYFAIPDKNADNAVSFTILK